MVQTSRSCRTENPIRKQMDKELASQVAVDYTDSIKGLLSEIQISCYIATFVERLMVASRYYKCVLSFLLLIY